MRFVLLDYGFKVSEVHRMKVTSRHLDLAERRGAIERETRNPSYCVTNLGSRPETTTSRARALSSVGA